MEAWKPLPRLAECVRPPTGLEQTLWQIPIAGWAIAHLMQRARFLPAVARVLEQLKARPPAPADVWGHDAARRELAYFLCQTLAREAGWPSTAVFVPGDPLATLCHVSSVENLGTAVALAIGDHLGKPLSKQQWAWLEQLTLGEAVEALIPHARRACPECNYDLTGNVTGTCPECGARTRFE